MFNLSDSNPFFIHPWMDEGRAVDTVYFDFSKAFDTMSHDILMGKVRNHGWMDSEEGWQLAEQQIPEGGTGSD